MSEQALIIGEGVTKSIPKRRYALQLFPLNPVSTAMSAYRSHQLEWLSQLIAGSCHVALDN